MSSNEKKYLVVKGSGGGGLGDRIRSVLVAALYANISKRILVIDWSDGIYADADVNAFHRLFQLKNVKSQVLLPKSSKVWPIAWKNRLQKTMHDAYVEDGWLNWDRGKVIEQYSFDLSKLDYEHTILVMWEFDQLDKLKPFYPEYADSDMNMYQYAFNNFLEVGSDLSDKIDEILSDFSENMLGVHVRATKEIQANKGMVTLDTYLHQIEKIKKKHNCGGMFIATDNIDIQQELLLKYPESIVHKKWFAKPWESLHLNDQCPDLLENARNALIDIVLLSKCQYLCYNGLSSFGLIAHIMSEAKHGNVKVLLPKNSFRIRLVQKIKSFIDIRK